MYKSFFKRFFDIVLSGTGILFLLPFFIILIPLISIGMKGNPFFVQQRPGKDGKIFKMIKFRTMTTKRDLDGNLLPDKKRLTPFGKFLRNTSIDELPQLFNVLKGDMSFVGPRPQLIKDFIFFDERISKRQEALPGITGFAQVNGRNNVSWEEKFQNDLYYVENFSLKLDILILIKTVFKVFKRADINTKGFETAEDYGDYLLRTKQITKDFYTCKFLERYKLELLY